MAKSMAALAEEQENDVNDDASPWPPRDHEVFEILLEKMRPLRILDKLYNEGLITKDEWIELQAFGTERDRTEKLLGVILPRKTPPGDVFCRLCTILKGTAGQEEVANILLGYANMSCPSPQQIKSVTVYIHRTDKDLARQVRRYIVPMVQDKLEILERKVRVYPFDEAPPQPAVTSNTSLPLVLTKSLTVDVWLKGVQESEFTEYSEAREIFIDIIAANFKIPSSTVKLRVSYIHSVGISLCLPLQNAGLQLIGMYRDRCEEIKLIWEFETKLPQLTQVDIYIGGLPVWSLPLSSSIDGDLDLQVRRNL